MNVELRRDLAAVAADGADPERIAGVLAWLVDPSRTAVGLRRAAAEVGDEAGDETGGAPSTGAAGGCLDRVLRPPQPHLRDAVHGLVRTWLGLGARVATVADDAFPARCRAGWPHLDVPPLLAWRGVPPGNAAAVAIVGARRATGYGTGVAAWLAEAAAAAGARVVSGGALGIDAAAHLAALDGPGGTTVVLGCGHAVRYPRPHAGVGGLFDRVLDHGGTLLSEQLPHAPAAPFNVRARNRIVAALADVVVVVEGGHRSGALVTATAAADRGVPVLAVPGDVRAPGSVAPHRLLAEGAAPCSSPLDLLEALGSVGHREPSAGDGAEGDGAVAAGSAAGTGPGRVSVLPSDVHQVLAAAWPRPVPVDDLAVRTGRPAAVLLGALTRARVAGETAEDASGVRLRRAPR